MKRLKTFLVGVLLFATVAQGATVVRFSQVEKILTPNTWTQAYAPGSVLAGVSAITGVPFENGSQVALQGVFAVDKDNVKMPLDLFFFNSLPDSQATLGWGTGSAFNVLPTDVVNKLVGVFNVPGSGYSSVGAYSYYQYPAVGTAANPQLQVQMKLKQNTSTLYVVAVTRGSGTWTAASNLQFRLIFRQI